MFLKRFSEIQAGNFFSAYPIFNTARLGTLSTEEFGDEDSFKPLARGVNTGSDASGPPAYYRQVIHIFLFYFSLLLRRNAGTALQSSSLSSSIGGGVCLCSDFFSSTGGF